MVFYGLDRWRIAAKSGGRAREKERESARLFDEHHSTVSDP